MRIARDISEAPRNSLWEGTAAAGPRLEPLVGDLKTDVAVIGAGVAGLSTALHLAEGGMSVAVVEADDVGAGATGKSGGLLAPDMIRHTPSELERLLGQERGSRLVHLIGSSAHRCFDLIEKHDLACDASQGGFWTPAHNQGMAAVLERRSLEWSQRGFNVSYVPGTETVSSLGTDRYCGAIRFADGGTLNPLAFSRSLAKAALRYGASIHVRSPVRKLERRVDGWRLKTDQGALNAEHVILAANGGNADLHPGLRRTVLPLDVIEFATTPLSAGQQSAILHRGVSFTDKQSYIFTARYDAVGRLISAFPDFLVRRSENALVKEASHRLEQYFPLLAGMSIEYLWKGRAWIHPHLLPKVYKLGTGAFAIQACNGRGLAANVVLGKEMASALLQRDLASLSVLPETPVPIRGHCLTQYVPSALMLLAFIRNRIGQPSRSRAAR